MSVFANIVSTFDPRGLNNARKSFAGLASDSLSASRKSQLAMKLVGGAAATAGAAVGAFAIKLGVDGVRAAIEDEKSVSKLANTLKNLGISYQQTNIEDFITKMQFAAGVADSALRPAMNQLLLATNNVTQSQRMLQLALDISSSTGRDLESVTVALSKAAMGNFTALTRLGVPLDKTIIKNKDLESALNALENQFQGASAAVADTYAGKIAILTQKVDEAKEAIGYDLITALELATGGLDGTNSFGDAVLNASDDIGDFIVGLGYYIGQIDVSVDSTNRFTKALEKTGQTIVLSILGPIYTAIPAIGKLFGLVANKGDELKTTTEQNALTTQLAGDRYLAYAKSIGFVTEKVVNLTDTTEKSTKATKNTDKALKSLNDAAIKAAQDGVNKLEESLRNAQNALDDVQGKFDDFKSTLVDGITGVIDFNSAVEDGDFLAGLVTQANNAKSFAEKVKTLIQLGLSERSLREVMRAGYESGTLIADQIIAGGVTVVRQVNELVGAVDDLANIVGQSGAETFYAAGIAQGQAMVKGIQDALDQAKLNLSALKGETTTGGMSTANEIKYLQTLSPTPGSAASFRIAEELDKLVQRRAVGGPVNAMQPYVVGEGGPELFVPNMSGTIIPNGAMASGGNNVNNFNISVNAGIGTDGAVVGRQIVDAIRKYERSSGQVFVRV
jgi:hypothetical protein